MTGVRQFDREDVLDRAARLFWRDGFEATSIQDLEAATGLGRGSLYNAFGDKASLFRAVLAHYAETEGAPPLGHLADANVFAGLSRMLYEIAARMDLPGRPRGCLITNTCVNGGGGAPTDAQIEAGVRAMEAAFETAFIRAQENGQLTGEAEPRWLARFYCAVVQSLGVMHRAIGDQARLGDIVAVALTAWPGDE
ncbi:TetR/AcrR family transcriptional regulator [Sphingomonas sp. UYP23]